MEAAASGVGRRLSYVGREDRFEQVSGRAGPATEPVPTTLLALNLPSGMIAVSRLQACLCKREHFMRCAGLVFALVLPLCSMDGRAQAAVAPPAAAAAASPAGDAAGSVKLGESAAELGGPWKFHTGDDPSWAQTDFDDSHWGTMDLTSPPDSEDPNVETSGVLPGWTSRGYPDYSGFAWYRLRINVQDADRNLALRMPDEADDAYQVFVNGTRIGEFGKFKAHRVIAYGSVPRAFRLPKTIRNGPMTIAIRVWMDSATPFNSPDAGGLHGAPVLGYASAVLSQVRLDFDNTAHEVGSGFLEMLILFMALLMAGALFWLDPHEKAYLALAFVCLVTLVGNSILLLASFTTVMGQTLVVILSDVIATPVRIGLWVLFWGYWFHLRRMVRLQVPVWALVTLLAIGTAMLRPPLYGERIPVEAAKYLVPTLLAIKLCLGVLLLTVAYFGFKRRKAEGGMAVAAVLLAVAANFQHELGLIHVQMSTSIFGFAISLGTISTILSLLIITVMLLRRFVHSQRRQEQWKLEIEQAQHVQQVLIPEKLPEIRGMTIESEYRPAREVGGDFFQILPEEIAGTPLIVVGDVTGKGLQAGMLVALIIGAIRTAVQHSSEPADILTSINDQLCEREHASATCMILRVGRDGMVDLAHAGHLPPYLNGREMELEGALPLGLIGGAEFPSVSFQLRAGDSLTLMSDGIAEAQDSHGRLFGFERVGEMMRRRATPAEIAAAAHKFGQEDDILVLRMQWLGEPKAKEVPEPELAAQ